MSDINNISMINRYPNSNFNTFGYGANFSNPNSSKTISDSQLESDIVDISNLNNKHEEKSSQNSYIVVK